MPDYTLLASVTIILLLLTLITLCYFQLDILEPPVILTGMMSVSCFFALLPFQKWELTFNFMAAFILIVAMLVVCIGSFLIHYYAFSRNIGSCRIKDLNLSNDKPINFKVFIPLCCISILLAYLSFKELYTLSLSLGNEGGIRNILTTVRPYIEAQKITLSRWMNYRNTFAQAFSYVSLYFFFHLGLFNGFQRKLLFYLIPTILYFPFLIFSTGRMSLICLVIYIAFIFAFLYQKKHGFDLKANATAVLILISSGALFLIIFLIMGILTGKVSSSGRPLIDIISHYAGLSIAAFSRRLEVPFIEDGLIGSTTLVGLYRILARVGLNLPAVDIFLPFTYFKDIDTNVYTAEWRYIKDFGYVGMCLILFLITSFYMLYYNHIKYNACRSISIIIYGYMCFPLFLSSIDERFFLDLVGTQILYSVGSIYFIYKLLLL